MATEYVKKFEETIQNFEEQANKLKQISEVMQAVSALVTEVENSKNEIIETNKEINEALRKSEETFVGIRDHVDIVVTQELQHERNALANVKVQISDIGEKISNDVVKLSTYTEQEEEARSNLIANLSNILISKAKEVAKEVYSPLEYIRIALETDNKRLEALINAEELNTEKYVEAVKRALVKSNSDNIDLMNGFSQNVGYKLEVLESKVQASLLDTQKNIANAMETMRGKVAEDIKVLLKDEKDARENLQKSILDLANKVFITLGLSMVVVFLLLYVAFFK